MNYARTQGKHLHSLHDEGNSQHISIVKGWKDFVGFGYQHHEGTKVEKGCPCLYYKLSTTTQA